MTAQPTPFGIKKGWGVAVVLREPVGDLGCFVGQIEHVDQYGLRLTLVDWITGLFTSYDFAAPWSNIIAITQIVTENHDWEGWDPGKFQKRHEEARKGSPGTASDKLAAASEAR